MKEIQRKERRYSQWYSLMVTHVHNAITHNYICVIGHTKALEDKKQNKISTLSNARKANSKK